MSLDCNSFTVAELIPHSPPMVLVDRVLEYDSVSLVAEVTISANSLFYVAAIGGVPAWVGIEYMAQAISALEGLRARNNGQGIKLGFLLGTRKLLLPRKVLHEGIAYQIHVLQLLRDQSGFATFECRIEYEQELCVAARINVYETRKTVEELTRSND